VSPLPAAAPPRLFKHRKRLGRHPRTDLRKVVGRQLSSSQTSRNRYRLVTPCTTPRLQLRPSQPHRWPSLRPRRRDSQLFTNRAVSRSRCGRRGCFGSDSTGVVHDNGLVGRG
jgi:hypothetical protein